jgi:hypothetical protein
MMHIIEGHHVLHAAVAVRVSVEIALCARDDDESKMLCSLF